MRCPFVALCGLTHVVWCGRRGIRAVAEAYWLNGDRMNYSVRYSEVQASGSGGRENDMFVAGGS
jgi:hypothetical protein